MRIPKTFELMGHQIEVSIRDDLYSDYECYGRWKHERHLIELQAVTEDITESFQMQTFMHEIVHAMLDVMSYSKLSKDEKFVDRIGQCLHQFLKTKKGAHG